MKSKRVKYLLIGLALVFGILACNLPAKPPDLGFIVTATSAGKETLSSPIPTSPVVTATTASSPTAVNTPVPTVPTATPIPPSPTVPQLTRSVAGVVASYLATAPIIDGDISDWSLNAYPVNAVTFGAAQWSGSNDLSGSVMVGWDNNNLYLGVHVTDDTFVQNASGNHMYEGDSIEVLLDTKLGDDFYTNTLSPDDFQLGMSPGLPNVGEDPESYLWYPESVEGFRNQVVIRAKKTSAGYDMEVSIPWNVFEMTPVAGLHYGFCFSISDNDKAGGIVQQSMASNVSTRHLTLPMTWGDLLLSK